MKGRGVPVSQEQPLLEAPPPSAIGWGRSGRRGPAVGCGVQGPCSAAQEASCSRRGKPGGLVLLAAR